MLFSSKSVESIVISIVLGTSIVFLETPKLSCIPGRLIPTTVVLLPSSITFAFVTDIFLCVALSNIVPQTTTNGVYRFSFLPFI